MNYFKANLAKPYAWPVVFLAAVVNLLACNIVFLKGQYLTEFFVGGILAVVFSQIGAFIKMYSRGKPVTEFFVWFFLLNSLNFFVFFASIVFVLTRLNVYSNAFVAAIFIVYFTFLIFDVARLNETLKATI